MELDPIDWDSLKVAVVHEWLVHYKGGVERVASAISEIFPAADHFALVYDRRGLIGSPLERLRVQPSVLQRLPLSKRFYRWYLPLMPMAVESLDLSAYDLVISLSHAVAKGVLTTGDQLHVSYLQARNLKYAYDDRKLYETNEILSIVQGCLLSRLRMWDSVAARRPDVTIANSYYVSSWHQHRHGVSSKVVYPPVDLKSFTTSDRTSAGEYYITVGRLEPYKRVDAIVNAFRGFNRRLVIVGDGSQNAELRHRARGEANIEFTGPLRAEQIAVALQQAKAFVFAAREDFGIAPLEAQACGLPVIAFGQGGALETVVPLPSANATGIFFERQSGDAIRQAIERFELNEDSISRTDCSNNASRFGRDRFEKELRTVIGSALERRAAG